MRQRVAIARTLILSPRIILMDEPFGALDPTTRLHMQQLLVDLWKEAQATVFFVTHSIEEAIYLGDRVYVFSSAPGTIIREMVVPPPTHPPKEMLREPAFVERVCEIRDSWTPCQRRRDRATSERRDRLANAATKARSHEGTRNGFLSCFRFSRLHLDWTNDRNGRPVVAPEHPGRARRHLAPGCPTT